MTEVKRSYTEGDVVVARRALVAPPDESWGVGVEIPAGSQGKVMDVDHSFSKPYTVFFDIGLEVIGDDDDIMLLNPVPCEPVPDVVELTGEGFPPYEPTANRPHRWCSVLHAAQYAVMGATLALTVFQQQFAVGLVMSLIVLSVAALFMATMRRKGEASQLPECMVVKTDERYARRALLSDLVFLLSVVAFLWFLAVQYLTPVPELSSNIMAYVTAGMFMVAWTVKETVHHHATSIVDTCDK